MYGGDALQKITDAFGDAPPPAHATQAIKTLCEQMGMDALCVCCAQPFSLTPTKCDSDCPPDCQYRESSHPHKPVQCCAKTWTHVVCEQCESQLASSRCAWAFKCPVCRGLRADPSDRLLPHPFQKMMEAMTSMSKD